MGGFMAYTLDYDGRQCIAAFSGNIDAIEISECNRLFQGGDKFDDVRFAIWDFSAVTNLDIAVEECIKIAAQDAGAARTNGRMKVALVVSDESVETFAHLYKAELLSCPWEITVFNCMKDALVWCV